MTKSAVVDDLLSDRTYHIEFNGHLTNHAKHAVIALAGIGAPVERIRSYYENYAKLTPYGYGLEPPKPSGHDIDEGNWRRYVGQRTSFGAYCDFFARQEKELGLAEVVRRYAPVLLPGWAGAFTHATIHLGWALDVGNRWMILEGLAYQAFSYVECHPERASALPGTERPVESLLRVVAAWEDRGTGLRGRVEELVADPGAEVPPGIHPELARSGLQYRNARVLQAGHPLMYRVPAWLEGPDPAASWLDLYYLATLVYLARPGDFVLLHLVTALHGMEQIAGWLTADQQRQALRCYWIGMLAIMLSEQNVPPATTLRALDEYYRDAVDAHTGDAAGWPDILARAIAEDEEHNPKLVYVLRRVWQRSGQRTVFRAAAAHFTTTPELPASFERPITE
jgi:hypothetical protein